MPTPRARLFVWLDRLFWLVWLLFALAVWQTWRGLTDDSQIRAEIDAACLAQVPIFSNLTSLGQGAVVANIGIDFAMLGVMALIAHRIIHRCAIGQVFIDDTLRSMAWLGGAVIGYAFVGLISTNALAYVLHAAGDLQSFQPNLLFDFPAFGFGLLVLTMRLVVGHAIALKRDQDLTI